MALLNAQNIRNGFLKITGLSEDEFKFQNIVDNAQRYVEKRIIPESPDSEEIKCCEYAACAHAVYDYTLQNLLSDRIIVTQLGRASSNYRENSVIQAAFSFRKSVFDSMKDLIRDDSFVFQVMED